MNNTLFSGRISHGYNSNFTIQNYKTITIGNKPSNAPGESSIELRGKVQYRNNDTNLVGTNVITNSNVFGVMQWTPMSTTTILNTNILLNG
jgi:hypothetical protein